MGMESHTRRKALGLVWPMVDFGDVRLPMNVNDADLHPNMTSRPTVHHPGATEMVYCLMKYEIPYYVRSWTSGAMYATKNPYDLVASTTDPEGMAMKNKVLADLEQIYERKYLRYCDASIPLHHVSATIAQITTQRLRFWYHHPRYQPENGRHMSQADRDVVFDTSIRILQLTCGNGSGSPRAPDTSFFSAHLLGDQLRCTEVDALVYVVSELRQRVRGGLVSTAWELVRTVYEDHYPQLLLQPQRRDGGGNGSFFAALADLILEAWDARAREVQMLDEVDALSGSVVPGFIRVLQDMKGNADPEDASMAGIGAVVPDEDFQLGLLHDDPLNFLYWDELPQF